MFRSCQIIIRELCYLLKLYYSIHNSIRICKRGVVAAYHVVWECVVEQCLGVRRIRRTPSHCYVKLYVHSLVDKLKWSCYIASLKRKAAVHGLAPVLRIRWFPLFIWLFSVSVNKCRGVFSNRLHPLPATSFPASFFIRLSSCYSTQFNLT